MAGFAQHKMSTGRSLNHIFICKISYISKGSISDMFRIKRDTSFSDYL